MKPIPFPEQNVVFAKDQPEYTPLPAHTSEGVVVCCWHLSLLERLTVLVTGKMWHSILTFGEPLQPQLLSVEKPEM